VPWVPPVKTPLSCGVSSLPLPLAGEGRGGACGHIGMMTMTMRRWLRCCVMAWLLGSAPAHALTAEDALTLAAGSGDERIEALNRLAAEDDARALALINALADDAVK